MARIAIPIESRPPRAIDAGTQVPAHGDARVAPEMAPVSTPTCRVTSLADTRCAEWDRYVLNHPDGTLFHTAAWRNAVADSFGHVSHYLTATRDERFVGVLPMFLVNSRLAGRMLVSVPYGVGGGLLANDGEAVLALFARAREMALHEGCSVIDLRSERAVVRDLSTVEGYAGFSRELPDRADDVLGWLPRKARAAARNARHKYGLTVDFDDAHLFEVWRLYSVSMRRLASLSYPFGFFRRLIENTPGRHWVSLVRRQGRAVAGLVTFLFKDRVMPYFFGSTPEAARCSAANFTYLTVMERGVAAGYRVFDFGRSRSDNTGSYNFKRFNGFEPRPLRYQRHTLPGRQAPDLTPDSSRYRLARQVWPFLPLFVTRSLGARLSRHIPG